MTSKKPEPPSEEIWDAIIDSGTPVADCDLCGRTHFDSTGEFMDEGELEDLLARAKADPEKYVLNDRGISYGYIAGKQVVYQCPCNGVRFYENLFWYSRRSIKNYLVARCKKEAKHANSQVQEIAEPLEKVEL